MWRPRECGVDEMSFPCVLINRASCLGGCGQSDLLALSTFTHPPPSVPLPKGGRGAEAPPASAQGLAWSREPFLLGLAQIPFRSSGNYP